MDVIDELRTLIDAMVLPPPVRSLEVGTRVMDLLCSKPAGDWCGPKGAELLMGVPIHVRTDMLPNAWCFLDADGEVVRAGVVSEP